MRRSLSAWTLLLTVLALSADRVTSQPKADPPAPAPKLYIVTPAGAKAGSTVEVVVSGSDLDAVEALYFSHPAIRSEKVEAPTIPIDPKSKGKTGSSKAMAPPASTAAVRFKVTVPADVPLGHHDVRVISKQGISNPRCFVVGDLPETVEVEPNNDVPEAQSLALNSTVHGAIASPTDVDYFRFTGKAGQKVNISCLTSSIDSRLQADVQVYDDQGRLLGSNRGYNGHDALVSVTLPRDGDYWVRVAQFTYTQGTPEYFYRLTVATTPWIDAVFPPMVEPGQATKVTIYGRNLPNGVVDPQMMHQGQALEKMVVTVQPPKDRNAARFRGHRSPTLAFADGFEFRVKNAVGTSNPVLIGLAQAPLVLDHPGNDTPETAQSVSIPCEIAGQIEKRRDQDVFRFRAKKGDILSLELWGDRIGSSADFYFTLADAATGKKINEFDDNPDSALALQFYNRSEDPARYRFEVKADGEFLLTVSTREAFVQAGPRDQYRLRITPEQPDFRLVAMPASSYAPDAVILPQNGLQSLTVLAYRQDGFDGPIDLSVQGLPAGVTAKPQQVPVGAKRAILVLQTGPGCAPWTGDIRIVGTATIAGQKVVREALPATITWGLPNNQNQQNTPPLIARIDASLPLAVREPAPFTVSALADVFYVSPGDRITFPLKVTKHANDLKRPFSVSALDLPRGLRLSGTQNNSPSVPLPEDKTEAPVTIEVSNNALPGYYPFVLRVIASVDGSKDAKGKPIRYAIGQPTQPITVVVLPKTIAELRVSPSEIKTDRGQTVELVVQLNRTFAHDGNLELSIPTIPGLRLTSDPVQVKPSQTEAKLKLVIDEKAAPQTYKLAVRAVAKFPGGKEISQEGRFTLSVAKPNDKK